MKTKFSSRIDAIPSSGIRAFFELVEKSRDIISLGVGEPDFSAPWTVREEAIYSLEKGQATYTSNMGLLSLREAVSQYQTQRFYNNYAPETEVLITNGVSEGVDITLRAILNPGDEVIIPQPMYVCYDPLVRLTGATVVSVNTASTQFVPTAAAIEAAITPKTKALVLCYPNNPTGMGISKSELEKIAAVVKAHDLWVLSDEIYAELSFNTDFVSIACLPGMKEQTLLLSGFSKAFAMTGFRVGYLCGPESLVSRACKIHQYSALCASSISQVAALEALKNSRQEVQAMVASYKRRATYFVAAMNKLGLETLMPDGSFYCFPSITSTGLSSEAFALQLLESESVAVIPGTAFGGHGEGYIRCCFASSLKDLKVAVEKISRFLKKQT